MARGVDAIKGADEVTHQPDIVERLRTAASNCNSSDESNMLASQAADEIERLREAVRVLAEPCRLVIDDNPDHDRDFIAWKIRQITNPIAAAAIREAEGRIG